MILCNNCGSAEADEVTIHALKNNLCIKCKQELLDKVLEVAASYLVQNKKTKGGLIKGALVKPKERKAPYYDLGGEIVEVLENNSVSVRLGNTLHEFCEDELHVLTPVSQDDIEYI